MPYFPSSTAIRRAEYDPIAHVLRLWFVESGGPYDYVAVPEAVYAGLVQAGSKGTYFNTHVRDRYSVKR